MLFMAHLRSRATRYAWYNDLRKQGNTKPHNKRNEVAKMMKKIEKNELFLCWILADIRQKILFIPKEVKEKSRILSRGEAALYFEYKNRYPNFTEVIVW